MLKPRCFAYLPVTFREWQNGSAGGGWFVWNFLTGKVLHTGFPSILGCSKLLSPTPKPTRLRYARSKSCHSWHVAPKKEPFPSQQVRRPEFVLASITRSSAPGEIPPNTQTKLLVALRPSQTWKRKNIPFFLSQNIRNIPEIIPPCCKFDEHRLGTNRMEMVDI